jgi:cobalt/nickel transport protein
MRGYLKAIIITLVCLAVLTPFASEFPDGLEKVVETFQIEEKEPIWNGLMPDYTLPTIENKYASTLLAGVCGFFLVLITAYTIGLTATKPRGEKVNNKKHLTAQDVALVGVFCALWVVLNLYVGPLGFQLWRLPILCDFSVFFTLLLTTWATGRFGTASMVGIIGAIIVLMLRSSPHMIGFALSAILFDALMFASKHEINPKPKHLATTIFATTTSAYLAGVIIGIFFSNKTLEWATIEWALTFWGVLHLLGGILGLAITLPVIGALEKANVRRIISA